MIRASEIARTFTDTQQAAVGLVYCATEINHTRTAEVQAREVEWDQSSPKRKAERTHLLHGQFNGKIQSEFIGKKFLFHFLFIQNHKVNRSIFYSGLFFSR